MLARVASLSYQKPQENGAKHQGDGTRGDAREGHGDWSNGEPAMKMIQIPATDLNPASAMPLVPVEYEIRALLDVRVTLGRREFLVAWAGFAEAANSYGGAAGQMLCLLIVIHSTLGFDLPPCSWCRGRSASCLDLC